MSRSDFTIALPKTKGSHRVGSYLQDRFDAAAIRVVREENRRDDIIYDLSGDGITFTGVHAESQDCAEALMDGVVDCAVIGMNRLIDVASRDEYADTVGDICFAVLDIIKTDCELVVAFSEAGPQIIEDGQRVLASHPDATRAYFNQLGLSPIIVAKRGGLETAGRLYGNCPIVDITQTGGSLRANGYSVSGDPILKSTAVIAWRRNADNPALEHLRKKLGASAQVQTLSDVPLLQRRDRPKGLIAA